MSAKISPICAMCAICGHKCCRHTLPAWSGLLDPSLSSKNLADRPRKRRFGPELIDLIVLIICVRTLHIARTRRSGLRRQVHGLSTGTLLVTRLFASIFARHQARFRGNQCPFSRYQPTKIASPSPENRLPNVVFTHFRKNC